VILAKHGLTLTSDSPIPLEAMMAALKEVSVTFGPNLLYQVGREVPRQGKFPPGIDTVEKALGTLDMAYRMNHSGLPAPGSYKTEVIKAGQGKVVADTPYPCHYDRGLLTELLQKVNRTTSIQHDDTAPCRRNGGASCTYHIRWS